MSVEVRPMADSTDPRAVRARDALVAAFDDTVADRAADELTVSALCRAAGVNRSTFYQHFSSPEDIALQGLGELFDLIRDADIVMRSAGSPITPAEASRRAIGGVVTFLESRRSSYARLIGPTAPTQLRAAVSDAFIEHSVESISRMAGRPADADPVLVARFLAGGVLSVLGSWLAEPADDWPAARLVDALLLCLPAWLMDPHVPISCT
ncbi:MAG: TetR/AcrR family transcriptional regulator [Aeromicrobium sp.]